MLKKTHLIIALACGLLFLPYVNYKLIFFPIVLFSALLPDIDSPNSQYGRHWYYGPLQFVSKHRGVLHSISFCFIFALILAFILPILAFPFFLGYSSHLVADSFTKDGISPFWPSKKNSKGMVRTGGKTEKAVFWAFVVVNLLLFLRLFT